MSTCYIYLLCCTSCIFYIYFFWTEHEVVLGVNFKVDHKIKTYLFQYHVIVIVLFRITLNRAWKTTDCFVIAGLNLVKREAVLMWSLPFPYFLLATILALCFSFAFLLLFLLLKHAYSCFPLVSFINIYMKCISLLLVNKIDCLCNVFNSWILFMKIFHSSCIYWN